MLVTLVYIASLLFPSHEVSGSALPSRAALQALCIYQHDVPMNGSAKSGMAFTYRFENTRFYIPVIDLQINADRGSKLSFKQGESDDTIDQAFTLAPETMDKLLDLITRSKFMESNEDYQSKKDFSHLGWITITATEGQRRRTIKFNYSQNKDVANLADIFRAIATQWIDIFHVKVAVEHQPLDLPAQLDALENDLQLERLAEPEQVARILRDISQDDTLPLIARNHADRIISAIHKKKYKSPVKDEK
jgi:hypothetical protein